MVWVLALIITQGMLHGVCISVNDRRIMNVFYINNQTPDVRVLLNLFSSYEQCLTDHCLSFFSFLYWPWYCLPFFNLLRLITTLVSSNFSSHLHYSI
jgi:hypothetical protein